MKTILLQYIILLCLISINSQIGFCQPSPIDSKQNIINGKLWVPSPLNSDGTPLLLGKLDLLGSMTFDSITYHNVQLGYDLEQNEVLSTIKTINQTKRIIALCKPYLQEFSFIESGLEYQFQRGDLIHPDLDSSTFYQVIFSTNSTYVIYRNKLKHLKQKTRRFNYLDVNSIYLIKNKILYPIHKKRDMLVLFNNQKIPIKKYIKKHKLHINPKHPMDAIPVIQSFDL